MQIGATLQCDIGSLAQIARALDDAGIDSLWSAEYFQSPFVRAAVIASSTRRAAVGTHVAQAFARSPLATALAAHELQRLSDGRFVLGLGSQLRSANRRWHGVEIDRPVSALVEYIHAVRALLDAPGDNAVELAGPRWPLRVPPYRAATTGPTSPVWVGAAGSATTRGAAPTVDGILGHLLWTKDHVLRVVRRDLADAGRAELPVTVARLVAPASIDGALEDATYAIAHYAATGLYNAVLQSSGFDIDAVTLQHTLRDDDRQRLASLVGPLVSELVVTDTDSLEQQIDAARRCGVSGIILVAPARSVARERIDRYELSIGELVRTLRR